MINSLCPCGSIKKYTNCCEIAHKDITTVTSAELLMRSRYSAFVKANIDYLLQSWSSKTKDTSTQFKKELHQWTTSVQWVKLQIIETTDGAATSLTGTVSFKAFYIENENLECISENSFFEKENGYWVYVSAL